MTKITTYQINTNKSYEVEYQDIAGQQFVVAPVTMMAEGVHRGSGGPILHTAEYLEKAVDQFDSIPTISYHPFNGQKFVGVNALSSAKNDVTGRVYNTRYDEEAKALKAEAWLSVPALEDKNPDLLDAIKEGKEINVSIGTASEDRQEQGEWNGEAYEAVTEQYFPDHLAILLDEDGACNLEDGCGIRGYSEQSDTFILEMRRKDQKKEITVNKEYKEFIRLIDSTISGMHDDGYTWVTEVYDSYFVYQYEPYGEESLSYFKQDYVFSESKNEVMLEGEPVEVIKNISYEVKANSKEKEPENVDEVKTNTHEGGQDMSCTCNEEKTSKIDNLIKANAGFAEGDREMLEGLDEKVIDAMLSTKKADEEVITNTAVEEPKQTQENPTDKEKTVEITEDQILNVLKGMDKDKVYSVLLSDEDQKVIKRGMKAYEKTKEILVAKLKDKEGVSAVYTEEQLNELDLDELEKTAKLVGIEESGSVSAYLGIGGAQSTVKVNGAEADEREPMILTQDDIKGKEDK